MKYYLSVTEYDKWRTMTGDYLLDGYNNESENLDELLINAEKIEEDLISGWKGEKDYDYYILISDNNDNVYYEKSLSL